MQLNCLNTNAIVQRVKTISKLLSKFFLRFEKCCKSNLNEVLKIKNNNNI